MPIAKNRAIATARKEKILHDWRTSSLTGKEIAKKYEVSESYPTTLAKSVGAKRRNPPPPVSRSPKGPNHGFKSGGPASHRTDYPERERKITDHAKAIINAAEVKRLFAKSIGRTRIAAMLRLPYAVIDRVLAT
jgi:hypothetical protein